MMGTPKQERRAKLAERLVRIIYGRSGHACGPGVIGADVAAGERYNVECRETRDTGSLHARVDFTEFGVSVTA